MKSFAFLKSYESFGSLVGIKPEVEVSLWRGELCYGKGGYFFHSHRPVMVAGSGAGCLILIRPRGIQINGAEGLTLLYQVVEIGLPIVNVQKSTNFVSC